MPRKPKAPKTHFPIWGGWTELPEKFTSFLGEGDSPGNPAEYVKVAKHFVKKRIEAYQREYEETSNPLFAWDASRLWLGWGPVMDIPLPSWVREHLHNTANALLADEAVIADVPRILGLEGKHHFTEYRKFIRDIKLAIRVAELYEFGEAASLAAAFKMVADESGKTERVVKDAYQRLNKHE